MGHTLNFGYSVIRLFGCSSNRKDELVERKNRIIGEALVFFFVLAVIPHFIACGGGGFGLPKDHDRFSGPSSVVVGPNFLDPWGHFLFIANSHGGTIAVVNAQHYSVLSAHTNNLDDTDVIRVGRAPFDIALTPAGDRLYVTDAWLDAVRVVSGWSGKHPGVFDVRVAFDDQGLRILEYDIEITELDIAVRAGKIAIPSLPEDSFDSVPVFITDPDNDRVLVLDSDSGAVFDEIFLGEEPAGLAVTRGGDRLFITTVSSTAGSGQAPSVFFVDTEDMSIRVDYTLELAGVPVAIMPDAEGETLYLLNADPPKMQVISLSDPPELLEPEAHLPSQPNGMVAGRKGDDIYVSTDNGSVYVFNTDTLRFCNSWGGRVFFSDWYPESNPHLERITVEDCLVSNEQWEVVYHWPEDEWTVRGTRSGLQFARAKSNQYYLTDDGAVGFYIRDEDVRASDEDAFYFEVDVGTAPIRLGLVPTGMAITPYYLNPQYEVIFIANSGSHSLSILFTEENQRIGVIH